MGSVLRHLRYDRRSCPVDLLVVVPAKLRVRIVPGWCVTAEAVVAGRSIVAPTALLIGGAKELT